MGVRGGRETGMIWRDEGIGGVIGGGDTVWSDDVCSLTFFIPNEK